MCIEKSGKYYIPIHGFKEIPPHLLGNILKQAGISRNEFFRLLNQILILAGIASDPVDTVFGILKKLKPTND